MENSKVNLFIVGAMKAGTTSFSDMLAQHPDIYMSPIKEPHYFIDSLPKNLYEPSRFFNLNHYFKNDFPKPHHIAKIDKDAHYEKLFSLKNGQKYLLDSSTCYLTAPESSQMIYNYNPDAKIIIIRRNTIDRAYSHYNMDLALGRTINSFEKIINDEIEEYEKGSLQWNSYLGMGFYKNPIVKYKALFKNNVLIIDFESFKNIELLLADVFHFLEIQPQNISMPIKNQGRRLKAQKLFFVLKKLGLKDYFSSFFGTDIKHKVFKFMSTSKKGKLILSDNTLKKLNGIIKENN